MRFFVALLFLLGGCTPGIIDILDDRDNVVVTPVEPVEPITPTDNLPPAPTPVPAPAPLPPAPVPAPAPKPLPPAPQVDNSVGIILVGDTGTGEPDQYSVAWGIRDYCARQKCDFGLLLGDNIYPDGVKSKTDKQFQTKFELPYKDLKFMFYPALGNHDMRGDWRHEVEYMSPRWRMHGRYYKISRANVDIFAIDTNAYTVLKNDKTQKEWLEDELKKSRAQWKIVYGHHPIYSYGLHGPTLALKIHILPQLEKYKVQFFVAGHDHHKQLIEKDDVAYVISGAGAKLRPSKGGKDSLFDRSSLGFAHLKIEGAKATLRFINAEGRVEYERSYTPDGRGY